MLKKPLDYNAQVEKLKEHGMSVGDEQMVVTMLERINYYRFTGYALQFRKDPNNSSYLDGTSFDTVIGLYHFDEDLRNTLRYYLEVAEIYYRTVISHEFALAKCTEEPYDQHYDERNYYNRIGFREIQKHLNTEKQYYKDSLIMKHHNRKYNGKMPLWVMVEMMSMSDVSKLYSCMYISEQRRISSRVNCGPKTLKNHLHCLSVLRNKCAHAARLYNTVLYPSAELSPAFLRQYRNVNNDTLFAYLVVLVKRLPQKSVRKELILEIEALVKEYSDIVTISRMGFPENWVDILKKQI